MPRILITNECHEALRKAATWSLDDSQSRIVLGGRSIPLEQETIDRLQAQRLEGETWSDCILRIVAGQPQ